MSMSIILKPEEKHYSKLAVTRLDGDYTDYEKVSNSEDGHLHITSQRIVFAGTITNQTIPFEKVLACEGTESILTINIDNGNTIDYDTGHVSAKSAAEQILAIVNKAETIPQIHESSRWLDEQNRQKAWHEAMALAEKQRLAQKAKISERILIACIIVAVLLVAWFRL